MAFPQERLKEFPGAFREFLFFDRELAYGKAAVLGREIGVCRVQTILSNFVTGLRHTTVKGVERNNRLARGVDIGPGDDRNWTKRHAGKSIVRDAFCWGRRILLLVWRVADYGVYRKAKTAELFIDNGERRKGL